MAEITHDKFGGETRYRIKGDTLRDVEEAIARIERSYHPVGYGTSFWPPKQQDDGTWVAHGHRSNSCD